MSHPTDDPRKWPPIVTAVEALQAIANLPTGATEDVTRGHEDAYRAVEALFQTPPEIERLPNAPSPSGVAEARAEGLEEAAGWHEQQIATLRAKGETMDAATRGMPRGQLRTIDAVLLHAKSAAAIRNLILAACPICAVPFKPDDMCLTDITEGASPMVDLETGEPLPEGAPAPVPYRYDSLFPVPPADNSGESGDIT